jgi:hypothetical protein
VPLNSSMLRHDCAIFELNDVSSEAGVAQPH